MAKRALVVGINDYPDTINDLPSCDEDANQFENLLRSSPYGFSDVVVYRDGQATLANVVDGLKQLFEGAKPDDDLVFFYSGHGYSSMKNDVLHEYLVFYDDMLSDDRLNELSQGLPEGALFTIVLDSCFSGGMEKRIFSLINDERARVKTWQAPRLDQARELEAEKSLKGVKMFGCAPTKVPSLSLTKLKDRVQADEANTLQFKGILLAACLATETAAASTSQTKGMSAFTCCLLDSLATKGPTASVSDIIDVTREKLRSLGFGQTPVIKYPKSWEGIETRPFLSPQVVVAPPAPNGNTSIDEDGLRLLASIIAILSAMREKSFDHRLFDDGPGPVPDLRRLFGDDPGPAPLRILADSLKKNQSKSFTSDQSTKNGDPTMTATTTTEKRWTDFVEPAIAILTALNKGGNGGVGKDIWGDAANSISREVRRGANSFRPEDLEAVLAILNARQKGMSGQPQAAPVADDKRWTDFVEPALAIIEALQKGGNGVQKFSLGGALNTPLGSGGFQFNSKQFQSNMGSLVLLARQLAEMDGGGSKDFWSHAADSLATSVTLPNIVIVATALAAAA